MTNPVFKILITIDVVVAAVIGFFFVIGVGDGSVSSFNIVLWIGILTAVAVTLIAGILLHRNDRKVLGNLTLSLLAVPATLYCAFFALIILTAPSWQ